MKRKKISFLQYCVLAVLFYFVCITLVYYIAGDQFRYKVSPDSMASVQAEAPVGEMTKGFLVQQTFQCDVNIIDAFSIEFATYQRRNNGTVTVSLSDANNDTVFYQEKVDVSTLEDNSFRTFQLPDKIAGMKGRLLTISVYSDDLDRANAVTVYYNTKVRTPNSQLFINGTKTDGLLCFTVTGLEPIFFGQHYFAIMGTVGFLFALYCFNLCRKEKSGKKSLGLNVIHAFTKYKFLLDQLVDRDFKTKYKRSVLGVLWSFLNPLLTMMVQYIVFSTIFKTDIPNYPVYLLTGIVFFNFFAEAVGMALNSIVSSASLITKVYIPKYIFPISRVMSSFINFSLSLIPLFIVIFLTGTTITPAVLLLPFAIVCTIIFCIGMGMLLASSMVFFRDTQFLWSVISLLWMYATPLFYPESIIPARFTFVLKFNPMYHFIRFARAVLQQGISPQPKAYLFCLIAALVPFFVGAFVFKKTQDKFMLYI
ncbi:MAG: Transport permease protein [Clostridium sp.]|jgi:ABC-2 type transport system permease protein